MIKSYFIYFQEIPQYFLQHNQEAQLKNFYLQISSFTIKVLHTQRKESDNIE